MKGRGFSVLALYVQRHFFLRASPMKRIMFAVLALVLAAAGSVQAQNPSQARPSGPPPSANGEILGTIVDTADKAPVARASITVRTKADSALVTGAYTNPDGTFRIQG